MESCGGNLRGGLLTCCCMPVVRSKISRWIIANAELFLCTSGISKGSKNSFEAYLKFNPGVDVFGVCEAWKWLHFSIKVASAALDINGLVWEACVVMKCCFSACRMPYIFRSSSCLGYGSLLVRNVILLQSMQGKDLQPFRSVPALRHLWLGRSEVQSLSSAFCSLVG